MNPCKFTPFGLYVKTKLLQCGKTQKWLESEINARTGMYVDDSYLYKIFTGRRSAPKISQAIQEILQLEDAAGERGVIWCE
ncbi:MAG: XRE family transcriptional regulator [Oscillospiraceae bacterium]|nr:XRE family transcriptional regulator [Oscillospiraceae bacterium]